MSNYIPNKQKKNKIFHKREVELSHAIKHRYNSATLEKAAITVQEAKLAAIRAQFAETLSPDKVRLLRQWRELTVDQIVERYSKGIEAQ